MNVKTLIRSILLIAIGAFLIWWALEWTPSLFERNFTFSRILRSLALLGGGSLGVFGIWSLLPRNFLRVLFLPFGMAFLFLLLLEGAFSFHCLSYGDARAMCEHNWGQRFWNSHPSGVIEMGDYWNGDEGKPRMTILGDSFVAGHGIKEPKDRFASILRRRLYNCYIIDVIGINGNSLQNARDRFAGMEEAPDILIYVHVPNDILDVLPMDQIKAILLFGDHSKEGLDSPVNDCVKVRDRDLRTDVYLFRHSFLFNYVVMHLKSIEVHKRHKCIAEAIGSRDLADEVLPPTLKISNPIFYYRADELFSEHRRDLLEFNQECVERGTELIVVLFPSLGSEMLYRDTHETINEPLREFLVSHHIPTLNLNSSLKQMTPREMTVNRFNSHPSIQAHRTVETGIEFFLINLGIVDPSCPSDETLTPSFPF